MSIFDTFASVLGGTNVSPSKFATAALDVITNPQHGGVDGILDKFRELGLDDAVRSWVGTGKNMAISKDDLVRALGQGKIAELAKATGVSHDLASTELANLLPQLVDKLSPTGTLPQGEQLGQLIGALKGKLGMI
jgi:uncharacterized protein YidB (DUF937 family)